MPCFEQNMSAMLMFGECGTNGVLSNSIPYGASKNEGFHPIQLHKSDGQTILQKPEA